MGDAYKDFNSAAKYFIRDLMTSYPEFPEFKTLFTIYKIVKSINKKAPQRYLRDLVLERCKVQIMQEDDSLFDAGVIDINELPLPVKLLLTDFNNIKEIWTSLEEKDKSAIWKHLKVLTILSIRCDD